MNLRQLKDLGLIKNGKENFYSKQRFKYFLTLLSKNYNEKKFDNIIFRVVYYDLLNKKYTKEINLSFSELVGVGKLNPPDDYVGRISYELKEIRTVLKTIINKERAKRS